jgi:hypothetical protein
MRGIGIGVAVFCVLLAACDENPKSDGVTLKGKDGSVTISANGQHFAISANGDKNGSFSMSGSDGHFTMRASDGKQTVVVNSTGGDTHVHMPDFVTSYPGAKQQSTTINSSTSGATGTVTFETSDSPDAVIAFYKQKAAGAGLSQAINMNMGPTTMFSAHGDGEKKVLQVVASSARGGAHVQVNWTTK